MNLQTLIGELIVLSNAYPETSRMTVRVGDVKAPLDMVVVESEDESLEIVLRG